ncbi:MAG: hypothetical protein JWP03_1357 [Phycisphaerales bacterium]|nr:hypothetical protein [Phycisphaerales bacterium]
MRLNRKIAAKVAKYGGIAFLIVCLIGNHGAGEIKAQTPTVIVGEVGFAACVLIGVVKATMTSITHRAGMKRIGRRKRSLPDKYDINTWG